MSQEPLSFNVSDRTHEAVRNLKDDRGWEYKSDSARTALEIGLKELGYLTDGAGLTPARRLAREVAKLLLYVAATLALLSIGGGVAYLAHAGGVAAGSLLVWGTDRYVLRQIEPAITNRLPKIEVNGRGSVK